MHSSLAPHLHDKCINFIELLHQCHDQNPFKKYLGACNDLERNLQKCLKSESLEKRRKNQEEAKQRKEKFQKVFEETEGTR